MQQHAASLTVYTYSDEQRQIKKDFIEKGNYYVTAKLDGDADSSNYNITEGTDKPTDVFKIVDAPTPPTEKKPKAVLTSGSIFDPNYTLNFVYDQSTYVPGKDNVVACYDVIETKYEGPSLNAETVYPK